jgi:hypothetical protein
VERQQRSHDRERSAGEHGAGVATTRARDREGDRRGSRGHRREAHAVEVEAVARVDLVSADEDQRQRGKGDAGCADSQG